MEPDLLDRSAPLPEAFLRWFASRGWTPRPHQLELLAKAQAGRSVLLIAPTGGGKTLAGFLPSLVELSGATAKHSLLSSRSSKGTGTGLASVEQRRSLISPGRDLRRS